MEVARCPYCGDLFNLALGPKTSCRAQGKPQATPDAFSAHPAQSVDEGRRTKCGARYMNTVYSCPCVLPAGHDDDHKCAHGLRWT